MITAFILFCRSHYDLHFSVFLTLMLPYLLEDFGYRRFLILSFA
ncbi:hypothetical protein [Campylobacter upsaliensis]|nr:hypothetical protein [Campylobacter upsaliensis]MCR2098499.1 hypothetical protein [Campylobacter upsaliensis]MCR2111512.1 hypothetical protein [Campylobacter upsaliensis]